MHERDDRSTVPLFSPSSMKAVAEMSRRSGRRAARHCHAGNAFVPKERRPAGYEQPRAASSSLEVNALPLSRKARDARAIVSASAPGRRIKAACAACTTRVNAGCKAGPKARSRKLPSASLVKTVNKASSGAATRNPAILINMSGIYCAFAAEQQLSRRWPRRGKISLRPWELRSAAGFERKKLACVRGSARETFGLPPSEGNAVQWPGWWWGASPKAVVKSTSPIARRHIWYGSKAGRGDSADKKRAAPVPRPKAVVSRDDPHPAAPPGEAVIRAHGRSKDTRAQQWGGSAERHDSTDIYGLRYCSLPHIPFGLPAKTAVSSLEIQHARIRLDRARMDLPAEARLGLPAGRETALHSSARPTANIALPRRAGLARKDASPAACAVNAFATRPLRRAMPARSQSTGDRGEVAAMIQWREAFRRDMQPHFQPKLNRRRRPLVADQQGSAGMKINPLRTTGLQRRDSTASTNEDEWEPHSSARSCRTEHGLAPSRWHGVALRRTSRPLPGALFAIRFTTSTRGPAETLYAGVAVTRRLLCHAHGACGAANVFAALLARAAFDRTGVTSLGQASKVVFLSATVATAATSSVPSMQMGRLHLPKTELQVHARGSPVSAAFGSSKVFLCITTLSDPWPLTAEQREISLSSLAPGMPDSAPWHLGRSQPANLGSLFHASKPSIQSGSADKGAGVARRVVHGAASRNLGNMDEASRARVTSRPVLPPSKPTCPAELAALNPQTLRGRRTERTAVCMLHTTLSTTLRALLRSDCKVSWLVVRSDLTPGNLALSPAEKNQTFEPTCVRHHISRAGLDVVRDELASTQLRHPLASGPTVLHFVRSGTRRLSFKELAGSSRNIRPAAATSECEFGTRTLNSRNPVSMSHWLEPVLGSRGLEPHFSRPVSLRRFLRGRLRSPVRAVKASCHVDQCNNPLTVQLSSGGGLPNIRLPCCRGEAELHVGQAYSHDVVRALTRPYSVANPGEFRPVGRYALRHASQHGGGRRRPGTSQPCYAIAKTGHAAHIWATARHVPVHTTAFGVYLPLPGLSQASRALRDQQGRQDSAWCSHGCGPGSAISPGTLSYAPAIHQLTVTSELRYFATSLLRYSATLSQPPEPTPSANTSLNTARRTLRGTIPNESTLESSANQWRD
ncbi:hypothetical protein PaG_03925 [Moesziomyces aphidis]|uniref:Uncharacterized protein n=1 Tax=Moesziomyces aphidis TaxID=84754 RepID=W3VM08_MOEAP|nr:hypothetical protein PaG_03925 [Moesziomyces aphidis]